MTTINWDEAMNQVGGDRDFLDEVLQDLLNEAETAEKEISDAIHSEDFLGVMRAAHRIKGSASYLCCDALKQVSLELQDKGHAGSVAGSDGVKILREIKTLFTIFEECLEKLRKEVAHHK